MHRGKPGVAQDLLSPSPVPLFLSSETTAISFFSLHACGVQLLLPFSLCHASSQASAEATANHHIQCCYGRCHQSPVYTALYLLHAQGRAASSLITIVTGPAPPGKLLVPPPPQRLHHGRRQRQRRASPSSREGFLLGSEIVDPSNHRSSLLP